jgi:hypothetical protein
MSVFTKATKKGAKARIAVFGCLRIAKGLGGTVAVIDTEHGSASKYSDRFDFDVCELTNYTIDEYIDAIHAASLAYDVLIIDSLSHAWQKLLEKVDQIAKLKYKNNTWSAWSEGTPEQRRLIAAILESRCHILATIRSKTEWTTESDGRKSRPVRVGLAPEQGKGIEYEFDMLVSLSVDHIAHVIKDRTGRFQDDLIDKPGEPFGQQLAAWLGDAPIPEPTQDLTVSASDDLQTF